MVDQGFLEYMDNALTQYEEYKKLEKREISFQEFLLLILTWKTEEILENTQNK